MDQGGYGGAFGGAKAGGAPDPLVFVKRPMVSLRICTLVSDVKNLNLVHPPFFC
jgi:hypothetical protein